MRGDECWIAQTHARLRAPAHAVRMDNRVPNAGVVVFYAGDKRAVRRAFDPRGKALLVAVRSDRHPVGFADIEIVQNASSADGVRTWHVPALAAGGTAAAAMPGGARIRTVLFPGTPQNLHPGFAGEAWRRFVADRGLEFAAAITRTRARQRPRGTGYRDVDVMLAVRPAQMGLVPH